MDERVTELEIKVAYLERAHDELSEVVRELFAKVEVLSRLVSAREGGEPGAAARSPEEEKPPHY